MTHPHQVTIPGHSHLARLAAIFSLAALTIAVGISNAAGERAEVPQIKVGDRWKVEQRDKRTGNKESDISRTVTSVSSTAIEGTENDGVFKLAPDLNALETSASVLTGEPKFLNFPLEVGKKWSFKYNFENKTNRGKGRIELNAEVVSYEKVSVPAGSFDAFRIESKGFWNNDANRSSGRSKSVYWYAPAAKSVVRNEYEDGYNNWVRELVELQLQP